jgi:hypothetical protein
VRPAENDEPPTGPDDDEPPIENEPQPDVRYGSYVLACGHEVTTALDTQERQRCPKCKRETFVNRVLR